MRIGSLAAAAFVVYASVPGTVGASDDVLPWNIGAVPDHVITCTTDYADTVFVIREEEDYFEKGTDGVERRRTTVTARYVEITPSRPCIITFANARYQRISFLIGVKSEARSMSAYEYSNKIMRSTKETNVYLLAHQVSVPFWCPDHVPILYKVVKVDENVVLERSTPDFVMSGYVRLFSVLLGCGVLLVLLLRSRRAVSRKL